jgi:hypothetical protein
MPVGNRTYRFFPFRLSLVSIPCSPVGEASLAWRCTGGNVNSDDWVAKVAAFWLRAQSLNDDEFAKACLEHPEVAVDIASDGVDDGRLLANRALLWQVLAEAPYESAVFLLCNSRCELSDEEFLRGMELCADQDGYMDFSCYFALCEVFMAQGWEDQDAEQLFRLLATSTNPWLRRIVAGADEYLPSDVLAELSVDPEEMVRSAAYRNPQATEEMRIQAAILGIQKA